MYKLRVLEEKDLQTRVDWLNNPAINSTLNIELPVLLDKTKVWFNCSQNNPNKLDMVLEHNDEIVAMTGFSEKINGEAESYTFVHPEKMGRGYGTIAQFLRLIYGFQFFDLKKAIAIIHTNNIASQKAVINLGFTLEGSTHSQVVRDGLTTESLRYICTQDDFNFGFRNYKIINKEIISY